jgi:hypothetical protein
MTGYEMTGEEVRGEGSLGKPEGVLMEGTVVYKAIVVAKARVAIEGLRISRPLVETVGSVAVITQTISMSSICVDLGREVLGTSSHHGGGVDGGHSAIVVGLEATEAVGISLGSLIATSIAKARVATARVPEVGLGRGESDDTENKLSPRL